MKLLPAATLTAFVFLSSLLSAKDAAGAKDHPLLKRITDSEIIWSKVAKFDELVTPLARVEYDSGERKYNVAKVEKPEGLHTTLYYRLPGETATLEAVRQYEADLKPAGFETLFTAENRKLDSGANAFVEYTFPAALETEGVGDLHRLNRDEHRYMALKGQGKAGNTVYVTLYAFVIVNDVGFYDLKAAHKLEKGQTIVRVDVLETKAMDERMTVVKAAEITQTIEQSGRIAIYGVHFDTGKADIKADSAESLVEMAKAIKEKTGQKFLIVGHTDNVGDFTQNQALSQKRAAAVTAALASKHGIAAASLIPVGVGMAAPVAANSDEAGRAKNRRVEMVAM